MYRSHLNFSFNSIQSLFLSCFLAILFLSSCSQREQKFTKDYFPAYYQFDQDIDHNTRLKIIQINKDPKINRDIVKFWLNNRYKKIYRQLHPVKKFSRKDLRDLSLLINQSARIYFISWPSDKIVTLSTIKDELPCAPLSNIEIQFLFSGDKEHPFSFNGLALIFISSHELIQQSGKFPVYPEILSSRLRAKYKLNPLEAFEKFNLFSKKSSYKNKAIYPGIVICRR